MFSPKTSLPGSCTSLCKFVEHPRSMPAEGGAYVKPDIHRQSSPSPSEVKVNVHLVTSSWALIVHPDYVISASSLGRELCSITCGPGRTRCHARPCRPRGNRRLVKGLGASAAVATKRLSQVRKMQRSANGSQALPQQHTSILVAISPNQQRATAVPRITYGRNTVKRLPSGCCSNCRLLSGMNLLQTPRASSSLKPSNPSRSRTKWARLTIAPTRTPVPTACRQCRCD